MSRKLDGVRCITIIDEHGEVKFFSRGGNEFLTLDYNQLSNAENAVLFDTKSFLDRSIVDARL
jgi:UDP-N-acetyl-D-galactosamine dehydrogenase